MFKKDYFFTAYCILVKYFLSKGLNPVQIKDNILNWEEKYSHNRYFDLNDVIIKYYDDNIKANGAFIVNISEEDVNEIKKRFDRSNERKIAFAMLCYAKIKADKHGRFYMSFPELSDWIEIDKAHIQNRYLSNIIKFDYIEKATSERSTFTWNKEKNKNYYQKSRFKINVDYSNDFNGKWVLDSNDILSLFDEIFCQKR